MPIRRQAIIWTNAGLGWWQMCMSLSLNELNLKFKYWHNIWSLSYNLLFVNLFVMIHFPFISHLFSTLPLVHVILIPLNGFWYSCRVTEFTFIAPNTQPRHGNEALTEGIRKNNGHLLREALHKICHAYNPLAIARKYATCSLCGNWISFWQNILAKAAPEVVKVMISSAAIDENIIKMSFA